MNNKCMGCGCRFDKPVFGKAPGGLLLNGCPSCGCGQYYAVDENLEQLYEKYKKETEQ